jgi:putative oxidoreductase
VLKPLNPRYLPAAQSALRIFAGLGYFSHGAQKLFGWFGGAGPNGGSVELMSRFGAAGMIEVVCGACIVLGVATHLTAFIASGEMAVAYFWMHVGRAGHLFWWQNHGELPMLYAFLWLLFAVWGAGPLSVDASLSTRRQRP